MYIHTFMYTYVHLSTYVLIVFTEEHKARLLPMVYELLSLYKHSLWELARLLRLPISGPLTKGDVLTVFTMHTLDII